MGEFFAKLKRLNTSLRLKAIISSQLRVFPQSVTLCSVQVKNRAVWRGQKWWFWPLKIYRLRIQGALRRTAGQTVVQKKILQGGIIKESVCIFEVRDKRDEKGTIRISRKRNLWRIFKCKLSADILPKFINTYKIHNVQTYISTAAFLLRHSGWICKWIKDESDFAVNLKWQTGEAFL